MAVDEELSPLVKRDFELVAAVDASLPSDVDARHSSTTTGSQSDLAQQTSHLDIDGDRVVLRVYYRATTPRMLRVAVNGFFESLNLIVQVIEELDVDVLYEKGIEGLEGVQGVEQGLTGTAVGVGG